MPAKASQFPGVSLSHPKAPDRGAYAPAAVATPYTHAVAGFDPLTMCTT